MRGFPTRKPSTGCAALVRQVTTSWVSLQTFAPKKHNSLRSLHQRHLPLSPEFQVLCPSTLSTAYALVLRGPNMMMAMPSKLTATPTQSVLLGRTLSTTINQTMATLMYTPP